MNYGYARCSTNETKQDINRQVRELKEAGADEIFLEYEHGDSKIKDQQRELFETAREGDTIITLDCRNGKCDPMSEAFLQMAGVFSQLELAMIRARVRSGMENARLKGANIGRPQVTKDDIPANFLRHYPSFKSGKLNVSELARVCDLSRTTVYKYVSLLEK